MFCLLLALVLFLGLPLELWAQAGTNGNSGNALNRLIEISGQLSMLNEKLQGELNDSRQNSRELQNMLETSKLELGGLRRELEALRSSSTDLLAAAENSQTELTVLRSALMKAESSLMSLEISFAAYREAAERKIKGLERQNRFWKWGCIGAGVLAVGFGTGFLLSR